MRFSIGRFRLLLLLLFPMASLVVQAQDASSGAAAAARHIDDRNAFVVQHVDRSTVVVRGGRDAGLAEGITLVVKRAGRYFTASGGEFHGNVIVALIEVKSVSNTSAMCEISAQNQEIKRGDIAWLSPAVAQPSRKQPMLPKPTSEPVFDPTKAQAPAAGFWTRPDQKPAQGVDSLPELSLAERARLARETTSTSSQPAPQDSNEMIPAPVNAAKAANSTSARDRPSEDDTRRTVSPTVFPTVSATNMPPAADRQSSSGDQMPSLAERALTARAQRGMRNQVGQGTATAGPAAEGVTTAATKTSPVDARTASTTPTPVSANVTVLQTSVGASIALLSNPPASLPAAASTPPKTSDPLSALPSTPVAQKADETQPATGTKVANSPAAPVGTVNPGPPVAPAVSGASAPQTAALRPIVQNPTIKTNEAIGSGSAQLAAVPAHAPTTPSALRTTFKVKYVAADALYIDGGKDAGLVEGMSLTIEHLSDSSAPSDGPRPGAGQNIAEVAVVSVSNTSAVCEIRTKDIDIQSGDLAVLSKADQDKLAQANTLGPTRKYPVVIAFSEGDPLDEEQREVVPKPPLPEINRARGRIGIDTTFINSSGASSVNTAQIGGVIRIDMSRIGGSYWNLNGYWRGRLNAFTSSTQPQSVYDLVNRTYTLGFTYVNPGSQWTAGVGRLYLPWATSLDTLDGGYAGRRFGKHTIVGAFAGTDPDPTSFNYNPDLRTAGTFVAFEAGSFEGLRFTSTEGIAVSGVGWAENRQFVFNETGLFYKRYLSVYNATQVDKQHLPSGGLTEGLSRSFSTLRVQPFSRFSIDVNHSYFRDVPTFSASLISTGLLDKYLFQGLSVGSRVELPGRISLYGNFGQSNRSGDTHTSLNQLYGITLGRLWFTGIRADVRYSKFASSFGSGNYRALSLSRNLKDTLRVEVDAGKQSFISSIAVPTDYRLLGTTVDLNLGSHYFLETVFSAQRGLQQSYNQWIVTTGYRFDTKRGK